uniref:Orf365 n=1 Tax=Phytophthora cinnamomi TaxID=4785 RepID=G8E8H3_PHYCI|nr:orf365 [Phytophthora cinnamomi]
MTIKNIIILFIISGFYYILIFLKIKSNVTLITYQHGLNMNKPKINLISIIVFFSFMLLSILLQNPTCCCSDRKFFGIPDRGVNFLNPSEETEMLDRLRTLLDSISDTSSVDMDINSFEEIIEIQNYPYPESVKQLLENISSQDLVESDGLGFDSFSRIGGVLDTGRNVTFAPDRVHKNFLETFENISNENLKESVEFLHTAVDYNFDYLNLNLEKTEFFENHLKFINYTLERLIGGLPDLENNSNLETTLAGKHLWIDVLKSINNLRLIDGNVQPNSIIINELDFLNETNLTTHQQNLIEYRNRIINSTTEFNDNLRNLNRRAVLNINLANFQLDTRLRSYGDTSSSHGSTWNDRYLGSDGDDLL